MRSDPRQSGDLGGRSINLALSERGLHALTQVGLREQVQGLSIPMRGRMMHAIRGELAFQPYGTQPGQFLEFGFPEPAQPASCPGGGGLPGGADLLRRQVRPRGSGSREGGDRAHPERRDPHRGGGSPGGSGRGVFPPARRLHGSGAIRLPSGLPGVRKELILPPSRMEASPRAQRAPYLAPAELT
jgi:hypothetical protein